MEQYAKKLHKKIQAIILGACSTENNPKIWPLFGNYLPTKKQLAIKKRISKIWALIRRSNFMRSKFSFS